MSIGRLAFASLLAVAALPHAPAHATITYTTTSANAGDPGQPGGHIVDDFGSTISVPQTSYWISGGNVQTCSSIGSDTTSCNSSIGNPPLIAGQPDAARPVGASGPFLQVNKGPADGSGDVGFFQLNLSSLGTTNISFLWGSVDQWNFAQLLDAAGNALITVGGTDLGATFNDGVPSSSGDMRLTFNWSNSDPVAILQFGDTFGPAMEVDSVSTVGGNTAAPEPGSIALLAAGLGAAAVMVRRRRGA